MVGSNTSPVATLVMHIETRRIRSVLEAEDDTGNAVHLPLPADTDYRHDWTPAGVFGTVPEPAAGGTFGLLGYPLSDGTAVAETTAPCQPRFRSHATASRFRIS